MLSRAIPGALSWYSRAVHWIFVSIMLAATLLGLGATPLAAQARSARPLSSIPIRAQERVVKVPQRETIWLLDLSGQRRWIADTASLRARGYRLDDVELVSPVWLARWPVGRPIFTGPLWQDVGTGEVFIVTDGRRRWIPDLVTFRGLGLTWPMVHPATAADLDRVPLGPPIPMIVTGWAPPPETQSPLPYFGVRPHEFAPEPRPAERTVDPRLLPALAMMRAYGPTRQWPDFLERAGVSLLVAQDTAEEPLIPRYDKSDNAIVFGASYVANAPPDALAATLIKQTVHAIYYHRFWLLVDGRECIREQAIAFGWEAVFWASQHGLGGKANPTSALGELHNLTLTWALDDRLDGALLAHFRYQMGCYFPGAFSSPFSGDDNATDFPY